MDKSYTRVQNNKHSQTMSCQVSHTLQNHIPLVIARVGVTVTHTQLGLTHAYFDNNTLGDKLYARDSSVTHTPLMFFVTYHSPQHGSLDQFRHVGWTRHKHNRHTGHTTWQSSTRATFDVIVMCFLVLCRDSFPLQVCEGRHMSCPSIIRAA